jgi:hypothetical protein
MGARIRNQAILTASTSWTVTDCPNSSGRDNEMSDSKPESQAVTRLISTEQREAAVSLLTTAFTNDAIPVDECERRVSEVYRAENAKALQAITRDLPSGTDQAAGTGQASVPARVDQSTAIAHRPSQRIASVLSSVERRLEGPMPQRLDVRSVMSSIELDLRKADFPPGVTEIHIRAILGNIEIELPDHVRVEDEGHAFLGGFSVRGRTRRRDDDAAPVVRITGRAVFGNVEVELDD